MFSTEKIENKENIFIQKIINLSKYEQHLNELLENNLKKNKLLSLSDSE